VILALLDEVLIITADTPAHSPAISVVGFTLINMSGDACTGIGTKISVRHANANALVIRCFLIALSSKGLYSGESVLIHLTSTGH